KPAHVPLAPVEARGQEHPHELGRELGADHLGPEAKDVHVVVLDTLVRGVRVVADGGPDPCQLARGDRRAHTRAAHEHRTLRIARLDGLADLPCLVGIVDSWLGLVRAEIDGLVAESGEVGEDALAQLDAAVVEGNRDLHQDRYVTRMNDAERWRELGQQLRVDSIRSSAVTKSGHPTSSMSAADLMAVLLAKYLHYDFDAPDDPHNDHLVFSKGHASPLLYSMYRAAGAIDVDELLTFRSFGSRLQGHPTPEIPWVDVATGS